MASMRLRRVGLLTGWFAAAMMTGACGAILGLDDFDNDGGGASGPGAGGASSSASASGASSVGGAGGDATSTSSAGGSGGTGGVVAVCGDGKVDDGEQCDGDCPTECIDADLCTSEELEGAADTCNAQCPFEVVLACKADDGCCPAGCFAGNDSDCMPKVIVVARDGTLLSIRNALDNTGRFGTVATFDATPGAPTLADLDAYAAVLVYTNANFADPAAMGDVLADYFDAGGRVVLANPVNAADTFRIRGRFEADGYHLLEEEGTQMIEAEATAVELMSPLVVDATPFTTSYHSLGDPVAGATVVAQYGDGKAAIVRGKVNGRNRVDVNAYPGTEASDAAFITALANALLYPSDP